MTVSVLEFALKAITPALVIGGWVVVYKLQALQARRKLLRESTDKVRGSIEELLESAIKFHTTEFDQELNSKIIHSLTHIEKRYELFPKIAKGKGFFDRDAADPKSVTIKPDYLRKLRQAITLEHFEDPEQQPLKTTDPQLQKIREAALELLEQIDQVLISALD